MASPEIVSSLGGVHLIKIGLEAEPPGRWKWAFAIWTDRPCFQIAFIKEP